MPSNHLILSIFPSIRVFSSESALRIRWPKYWSFSFSPCPSNEFLGLIPFRIDWFDLAVQRDSQVSSPAPQSESINSLALSFLYGPTLTFIHDYWKNHSFDYRDLCHQSDLFFNILSRFVIAFLPRSKCFFILWLQSLQWFWEPKKICRCFPFSSIYLPWSNGTRCHDLNFLNVEF